MKLKMIQIGKTGVFVQKIGLGSMPLSLRGRPRRSKARKVLIESLKMGTNFIDTANVYCLNSKDIGHNEILIQEVLREKNLKTAKKGAARKMLSVFQFTISVILIFGTITINKQLRFINYVDLGFDKDQVLWFETPSDFRGKTGVFKTKLLANPDIRGVAMTDYTKPGVWSKWGRQKDGNPG